MEDTFMDELSQQCEKNISIGLCDFAILCEFLAATAFVVALVPQIHKNFYLKSVKGLSILWVTILFTATLLNCFYIFEIKENIYLKVVSIISCAVIMGILLQFWMYSKQNMQLKMTFCGCCFVLWGAMITLELAVPKPHPDRKLEWVSVILFSVDLIPQVVLNIMCRNTSGQSNIAVVLATLAKAFRYLALELLVKATEFRVTNFIAMFVGNVNCFQLLWYRRPALQTTRLKTYGTNRSTRRLASTEQAEDLTLDERKVQSPYSILLGKHATTNQPNKSSTSNRRTSRVEEIASPSYYQKLKSMAAWKICVLVMLSLTMIGLSIVSCIVIKSGWLVVVPLSVLLLSLFTVLYRDHKEGRFNCCENNHDYLRIKFTGR
eukprot:gene4686-5301_t